MKAVNNLVAGIKSRRTSDALGSPRMVMQFNALVLALAVSLLVAPLSAEAQSVRVPRVGLLGLGSAEASPFFEALRQGLRERGWSKARTSPSDGCWLAN